MDKFMEIKDLGMFTPVEMQLLKGSTWIFTE